VGFGTDINITSQDTVWHVFTMRDVCNVWQGYLMFSVLRFYSRWGAALRGGGGVDGGNAATEMWKKNGVLEWHGSLINDGNFNILA
jgi:hypothetical protein